MRIHAHPHWKSSSITQRVVSLAIATVGISGVSLAIVLLPASGNARAVARGIEISQNSAEAPWAIDRGLLVADTGTTPISVTVALHLPALEQAENLMSALHSPGDPQFHKFLSADEFVSRFAPKDAEVARAISALGKYGLSAERTTATTIKVTGLPADMERAFTVTLHSYEVPAKGNLPAYRFHAPLTPPTIPAEIAQSVSAIVGLDSRHSLHPHAKSAPQGLAHPSAATSSTQGNAPGMWTVTDFASYYDVVPLYRKGLSGKGRTMGIVTLANFTPSDVYAYWNSLGLNTDPTRIQVINIDGGPGAPSDASDSEETTLDLEQSGGVAPGAKIIVYQGPNTDQAWVDAFAAAVDSNAAESISTSWGTWEWYDNLANGPVTDPTTGRIIGTMQALHELFVRAAIQGQTLFASAGDNGAYDPSQLNTGAVSPECFPSTTPSCSITLGVDNPADDPAITAAGGTTVPGPQGYCLDAACTPPLFYVNVPHERVWGWDYLESFCVVVGTPDPIACGIFPGGSGGGVSVLFPEPSYQFGVPGTQTSQPGQNFVMDGQLLFALPAHYAGRNLPDISLNADPETGYVIWYTSDVTGFGVQTYWGGTSFVGPQLNGVTALIGEKLNGRLGLLNFPLYALGQSGEAYKEPNAPLNPIRYGDNWFYYGSNGYNLGVGFGTMDVANFAEYLANLQ